MRHHMSEVLLFFPAASQELQNAVSQFIASIRVCVCGGGGGGRRRGGVGVSVCVLL